MKLCRFLSPQRETRIGLLTAENQVLDLSAAGTNNLTFLLETKGVLEQLEILDLESRTIMKKGIFVCMTTSRGVRRKTRDIES